LMAPEVLARYKRGETMETARVPINMVDLPLGATEDRVCGTIDIAHLEANVMSIEKPPLSAEKMARLRQLFGHIATSIGN